jgi:predicted membrane protein
MKNSSKFVLGVILIVLGILFLVDQVGLFNTFNISFWNIFWTFWPLILIFLGVKVLVDGNSNRGIILLVLGVVFLSTNLFKWDFFSILWPVIIITIGLSILFKRESGTVNASKSTSSEDTISESVVFWGVERKVKSKNFKGGDINVAFGGMELDLREAKIAKEGAKLNISCAFGGVELFVPKDCRVKTNGTGILGGWDSKVEEREVSTPVLEISGGVAFGGVEIK